jgi:hypothetical protein
MQLTVAFASTRHARDALRFLAESSLGVTAYARAVVHEDEDMALVDIEIPHDERSRLDTLLLGVHGIVIEEQAASFTAVA